jgi:hypothetical protein
VKLDKRKLNLLFIKSNLHRLSNETLEKIATEIYDEVEEAIEKELNDDEHSEDRRKLSWDKKSDYTLEI